ncbi:hypothetical protein E3U43_001002 [Larimichthys crocea]|uniref:Uncharacterized protein n=1 Tax=Larimichthys crocea TaxID=215358 RepID=A0ACD3QAF6_LARCR|nr:hypothetical protein E3U43_001002 [Larimichthys crocea]
MWTEVKNKSGTDTSNGTNLKMVDPDLLTWQLLHTVQQRNGSTAEATRPSSTEDSLSRSSGLIPGAIAATVFIAFLLALYAVLWKCMVSPPQRHKENTREYDTDQDLSINPSKETDSTAWMRHQFYCVLVARVGSKLHVDVKQTLFGSVTDEDVHRTPNRVNQTRGQYRFEEKEVVLWKTELE